MNTFTNMVSYKYSRVISIENIYDLIIFYFLYFIYWFLEYIDSLV